MVQKKNNHVKDAFKRVSVVIVTAAMIAYMVFLFLGGKMIVHPQYASYNTVAYVYGSCYLCYFLKKILDIPHI